MVGVGTAKLVVVAAAPRTRQLTVPHYNDRLGSNSVNLASSMRFPVRPRKPTCDEPSGGSQARVFAVFTCQWSLKPFHLHTIHFSALHVQAPTPKGSRLRARRRVATPPILLSPNTASASAIMRSSCLPEGAE